MKAPLNTAVCSSPIVWHPLLMSGSFRKLNLLHKKVTSLRSADDGLSDDIEKSANL